MLSKQFVIKKIVSSFLLATLAILCGCIAVKENLPVSTEDQREAKKTSDQLKANLEEASLVFDSVQFEISNASFAWPVLDNSGIYIGSGFRPDCKGIGQVRKIDLVSLNELWKADVMGSIGDTRLLIADEKIIVAAGERVYALSASDGKKIWETNKFSGDCFQESMGRLSKDKETYFIGSSKGRIAAINVDNGLIIWAADMSGPVFGMPLVIDEQVIWADMSGPDSTSVCVRRVNQWSSAIERRGN